LKSILQVELTRRVYNIYTTGKYTPPPQRALTDVKGKYDKGKRKRWGNFKEKGRKRQVKGKLKFKRVR
jgi:hypothetical protein